MRKSSFGTLPKKWRSRLAVLIICMLLLYVVLPRIGSFSSSLSVLRSADIELLAIAFLCVLGTYVLAAGMYVMLTVRGLHFWPTFTVQAATAFANRLLPAGLGGLTLYVEYLRKRGYTTGQAVAIAATNNTLGTIGHAILLAGVAFTTGQHTLFRQWHLPHIGSLWLLLIPIAVVLTVLMTMGRLRAYVKTLATQVVKYIVAYRHHPWRLATALLFSMSLTMCHVAALYLCGLAVGMELSVGMAFIVFSAGVLVGTATPTPGGLGGIEAGLVAALVAYKFDASTALAAVLLFRLLTYWVLLLPGFAALLVLRKKYFK